MKNNKFYSIWFKMAVIFAVLIGFSGISLFAFTTYRFDVVYRQQAQSHLEDVCSLATANTEDILREIDQLSVSVLVDQIVQSNLKYINTHPEEAQVSTDNNPYYKNTDAIVSQVRGSVFNTGGVVSLRIYSLEGVEIFVGTTNTEYLRYNLTPEEIYAANGAALWEMNGEKNYICMCRAILSTSTMLPLGYMVIVSKNEYFSSHLSTIPAVYSSEVYLVDEDSRIVASSSTDTIGSVLPDTIESLSTKQGQCLEDPASGKKSICFVGSTLSNGWKLMTTVTKERFTEEIIQNAFTVGVFLLILLCVVLVLTFWAIKEMAEPTKKLLQSISAFGEGNLSARVDIQSRDEIGKIGEVYNRMAENIETLLKEVYTLEIANKEAEIEQLKMQITPHFLYNTLDTISWLGFTNGCEEITDLAVSLAQLLRSSIKNDNIIKVEQELKTVQDYLYIQSYRFKDRFTPEYDIDPEAYNCYMPNFLLQPLIENSIIHGLESELKMGVLRISIKLEDEWLKFAVSDNGKGMDEQQVLALEEQCKDMKSRNSIGLKNVYRRLELMYHGICDFKITSQPDKGTCISFRLPADIMP